MMTPVQSLRLQPSLNEAPLALVHHAADNQIGKAYDKDRNEGARNEGMTIESIGRGDLPATRR